jgi:hypothetical protein
MTRTRLTIFTLALLASFASQVAAFDLTGTWTGARTCKEISDGTKDTFKDVFTADVTQTGNAIGLLRHFEGGGQPDTPYAGLANFLPAKPDKGEFAIIHCGTDDVVGNAGTYDSVGRMQVTTKPGKIKATIKGTTIYSNAGTVPPVVGTCTWKMTRTGPGTTTLTTVCPVGPATM